MPRLRTPARALARAVALAAVVASLPCLDAATTRPATVSAHSASGGVVLGRFGAPFAAVRTPDERASRGSSRTPLTTPFASTVAIAAPALKPTIPQAADLRVVGAQRAGAKLAAAAAPAAAKTKPAKSAPVWVRPNAGPLSSPFGRRWGRMHSGLDLAGGYGSPIVAAAAGVVTYAGPEEGFGRIIKITEPDGTQTWYGHMSRYLVKAGDRVHAGERIALVGAAGDATGPHLHFEVHVGGRAIDPLPFLRAHGVRI